MKKQPVEKIIKPVPIHIPKKDPKDLKEIISAVKEVHGSIAGMVAAFANLPSSKHKGVSGELLLTTKEKEVLKLIGREQDRADRLMKAFVDALNKE